MCVILCPFSFHLMYTTVCQCDATSYFYTWVFLCGYSTFERSLLPLYTPEDHLLQEDELNLTLSSVNDDDNTRLVPLNVVHLLYCSILHCKYGSHSIYILQWSQDDIWFFMDSHFAKLLYVMLLAQKAIVQLQLLVL